MRRDRGYDCNADKFLAVAMALLIVIALMYSCETLASAVEPTPTPYVRDGSIVIPRSEELNRTDIEREIEANSRRIDDLTRHVRALERRNAILEKALEILPTATPTPTPAPTATPNTGRDR